MSRRGNRSGGFAMRSLTVLLLAAGAALAAGDWTQTGGMSSHQQRATSLGLPASPPSNVNCTTLDFGISDAAQGPVIGPNTGSGTEPLDVWGVNSGYLYRFNFTPGTGMTQSWRTQLNASAVPANVAVDSSRNSYVFYGSGMNVKFASLTSSGTFRNLPSGSQWNFGTAEAYGPALASPASLSGGQVILWGFIGTEFSDGIGHIKVWDTSGNPALTGYTPSGQPQGWPPSPYWGDGTGRNAPKKFGVQGLPAAGPRQVSGVWQSDYWGYFPGLYKEETTNGTVTYTDHRIYRFNLNSLTGGPTPELVYSVGSSTTLKAMATDDISGSSTRGNIYVWQSDASGWSLACINEAKTHLWTTSCDPAAAYGTWREPEPVAVGSSYVYARQSGSPGTIVKIDKSTGTATAMSPTFTSVGPITIGLDGSGVEYLCFKDGSTLNVRAASNLALLWSVNVGGTGNSAVPIGQAPTSGGTLKPTLYSWGQFGAMMPQYGMRAYYAP